MRKLIPALFALVLLVILTAHSAAAQPTLDSLWPYEDGKSWSYLGSYEDIQTPRAEFTARLIFEGTGVLPPGVEVRNLIGQIDGVPVAKAGVIPAGLSPLLHRLWIARPDLREAIEARAGKREIGFWPSLLLGPSELASGIGHLETSDRIGSWRDSIADWSWWYLTDQLFAGANFTLQLVPDLADDVFLHGTVRGTAENISTGAGDWSNATIVDYIVDSGVGGLTNEQGEVIGTVEYETRGWVAFVPDVGPVASSEQFELTSVDCPLGCEEEGMVGIPLSTSELSLQALPVATVNSTWGELKAGW